jgi:negative regulator of flagellin synthesis FlgM
MNTDGIGTLPPSLLQQSSTVQKAAADPLAASASDKSGDVHHAPVVDQASLSHTSTILAQALSGSDVRMDKVASLQQAIASGNYHVSSADVADSILKSLME